MREECAIIKYLKLMKMRHRYFIAITLISIIPLAVLGITSYYVAKTTLMNQQINTMQTQVKASSERADVLLKNIINMQRLIAWNSDMQAELKKSADITSDSSREMEKSMGERMEHLLYSYFIDTQDVDSVCIFDKHFRAFCYGNSSSMGKYDTSGGAVHGIDSQDWYRQTEAAEGKVLFFSRNVLLDDPSSNTFSSVKLLRDSDNVFEQQILGVLVVNIHKSIFSRVIEESPNSESVILDQAETSNRVVYTEPIANPEKKSKLSLLQRDDFPEENHLISSYRNETTGWAFVHIIEKDVLFNETYFIRNATGILVGLMAFLALILSFITSGRIMHPLTQLKKLIVDWMKTTKERQAEIASDDISLISNTFKQVTSENMELNHLLIRSKLEIKEAELNLLQAQIKPHFLYNTLDAIYWMAIMNDNQDIAKMTSALSETFKLSLSKGKEMITVDDELAHIRHYVTIQQLRFPNRITYEEDVDDALLDMEFLKLLLQPLVENAIYHGLEPKMSPGIVRLTGKINNDETIFIIEDNGVGIEEMSNTTKGFGLKNVQQRMELYYPSSTFSIRSEMNLGTTVELRFPIKTRGDS
ncbi:two-component system, sensor histidine kinase YesM [Terribacillus halophilus]|uniref:Two-component system, sensor histidine kinase YesM n=1 Tax=Terribacillus halophilus TaxID=361279 RepID=A0A1G6VRI4_9BACI|nr:sensor histidine kinase [Terribacillus halophilus]SDD55456.1 two-component system, sensor histidine kinase YesM [Terribacillus halophilus]